MELKVSSKSMKAEALEIIEEVQRNNKRRPELDFISLALQGRKIGFEKVIGMIDDLVAELKVEQTDDDNKKEYCAKQFDESDDKKKSLEHTISDLEKTIA